MSEIALRDKLSNKLISTHDISTETTIESWLSENVDGYEPRPNPPISITINDRILFQRDWGKTLVNDADTVVIYAEPKAEVGVLIIKALISAAVSYAISAVFSKQPDNYNSTVPDGSSIYSANGQGNSVRLNGVIPELFGRHKYYPDVVSAPRREYIENEEWLFLTLCAGVGRYSFEEVNIGETPIDRYSGDIESTVYLPGEDVSQDEATRNVYTSLEVDGFELTGGDFAHNGDFLQESWLFDFGDQSYETVVYSGDDDVSNETVFSPAIRALDDTAVWPYAVGDLISVSATSYNHGYYEIWKIEGPNLFIKTPDGDDVFLRDTSSVSASIEKVEVTEVGDYIGPMLACPISTDTDEIVIDLLYMGLAKVTNEGDLRARTVDVDIEWREVGTENWTVVSVTRTAATRDELGDTIRIPLDTSIVPEVRLRRMTAANDDASILDEVRWMRLKSELGGVIDNTDVTLITVKMRGTNALSSAAQNQFNTIQIRHLPVYGAGAWLPAAETRDIAPVFAYMIKDCGHPDERIALDKLEELHTLWSARGDTFDGVFDDDTTLFESLKRVVAVGYAQPTINNSRIVPIREGITDEYGQMFTPDNTGTPDSHGITEEGTLFDPDEPDGVTVEYFDSVTWKSETVDCLLDEDTGDNMESVRAFGITDKTMAWRFGQRIRRARKFTRRQYTIDTEMEALNANLMDKCSIPSRDTQSGWCEAYDNSTQLMTLSDYVEFSDGQHYISIRRPDGTMSGVYECERFASDAVKLSTPLDFNPVFDGPEDPPLYKFGTAEEWHRPILIRSIEPQANGRSIVTASVYDERVYADDDNEAP